MHTVDLKHKARVKFIAEKMCDQGLYVTAEQVEAGMIFIAETMCHRGQYITAEQVERVITAYERELENSPEWFRVFVQNMTEDDWEELSERISKRSLLPRD
jgi:hypothetical protein